MIRFTEASMIRFGKFFNVSLLFSDGLQVIYGGNEAGKSTVQLFIKVMLYGISGSKKDGKGLKLRDRIIPWEEKNAEGILRVVVDGRNLEIYRKFGKTASGDKTEIRDCNTGEILPEFHLRNLGEQLMGIPETVFEKTLWLHQDGAFFSGADEEINKRLMNLMETGTEEISIESTHKNLERELKAIKAKDKRGAQGELDKLWTLREEKIQERYHLLSKQRQREAEEALLIEEKKKLEAYKNEELRLQEIVERKKKLVELETKQKKWDEGKRISALAEQAESREVCKRFSDLSDNKVQKAEILEKRREILDQTATIEYDIEKEEQTFLNKQKQEQKNGIFLLIGVILMVTAVGFAVLRASFWGLGVLVTGVLGIFLVAFGFFQMQKAKKDAWQAAENKRKLLDLQEEKKKERDTVEKEYQEILEPYGCKNSGELREGFLLCKQAKLEAEGYRKTYAALFHGEDVLALAKEVAEAESILAQNADILVLDAEAELAQVRQQQMESLTKIKETESKLSYVFHGGKNPADTETELLQINKKIEELEKRQKALKLALEVFQEVADRRKSDFTPRVNEKVNGFLDILTGGRYRDVRTSEEYQLHLLPDQIHLYPAEFFSKGTYEQVYFSLRLALASLLGDGTEPMFLDDFLMAYDDVRAGYAMELLEQLAQQHQIILFSCHSREVLHAKKRNLTVRYLEEEGNDGC